MWRRASLSWNSGIPENRKTELVNDLSVRQVFSSLYVAPYTLGR